MEKKRQSHITINWQKKKGRRGLTEAAIEMMRKVSEKPNNPLLEEQIKSLEKEYSNMWQQDVVFSFDDEIKMVQKYVRVRL